MKLKNDNQLHSIDVKHPLIRAVADITYAATGIELTVVYPDQSGWGHKLCGAASHRPEFCRLMQSGADKARHCSMSHVLMAVAACSGSPVEQRCHAGAAVIVQPAGAAVGETVSVLSSCMYAPDDAWKQAKQRGIKLGLELKPLRAALLKLKRLNREQINMLKSGMKAMAEALKLLRENAVQRDKLEALNAKPDPVKDVQELLRNPGWAGNSEDADSKPLLVRVVCELARQRPDLALSVKELSAAAHLTPNHFTTMFHQHVGVSFNQYLTDLRIERAKKLLGNPLLHINEIARMSGYEDPGYFARRFRSKTGITPGEWRDRDSAGA